MQGTHPAQKLHGAAVAKPGLLYALSHHLCLGQVDGGVVPPNPLQGTDAACLFHGVVRDFGEPRLGNVPELIRRHLFILLDDNWLGHHDCSLPLLALFVWSHVNQLF